MQLDVLEHVSQKIGTRFSAKVGLGPKTVADERNVGVLGLQVRSGQDDYLGMPHEIDEKLGIAKLFQNGDTTK